MGKITQGILGGFSGKVGTVIGGNWKGIDYMRSKASKVTNPNSKAQKDQRSKFSLVLSFLQPMTDFIKIGFKDYAIKMTAFNSAMSYNVKNAIAGVYPDYSMDYTQALVSRGSLAGALNPAANSAAVGEVTFTWDDNSVESNANADDLTMLLVLNEDKKEAVFTTEGSTRDGGTQTLTIPDSYSGDSVECFIAFISIDGEVANSKYIGSVVVA